MLSRARFDNEEVDVDFFEFARLRANTHNTPTLNEFNEDDYKGEWLLIGRFLSTMVLNVTWTKHEAWRIRKKAYRLFLRNNKIWRHRRS